MSYILEALKKSEQERRRGDVPDLQTVHLPVFAQRQSHTWPYVVIVFLLLVLAFVLGMVMMKGNDDKTIAAVPPSMPQATTKTVVTEQTTRQDDAALVVTQAEPVIKTESVAMIEPVIQQAIEASPSLEMDSVPHLSQLPSLIQQAIPNMTFAGHVYSSNPIQRSVIINGHAMSEGDVVINNLKVEQITRSGVVFDFDGQLFRMDILQDWSFE